MKVRGMMSLNFRIVVTSGGEKGVSRVMEEHIDLRYCIEWWIAGYY